MTDKTDKSEKDTAIATEKARAQVLQERIDNVLMVINAETRPNPGAGWSEMAAFSDDLCRRIEIELRGGE